MKVASLTHVLGQTLSILFCSTAAVFFCIFPAHAGPQLKLVTDSFPPYYYQVDGKTDGIMFRLIALAFKEMKMTFSFEHVPWQRALIMAETGKSDAIPGIAKTPERESALFFPEEPLLVAYIVLFYKIENKFDYKDITSLNNKRVGVIRGYSYGPDFDHFKGCIKEPGESLLQNFNKLAAGRLDLVIAYKDPGLYTLNKENIRSNFHFSANPVHKVPLYLAFSRKPGHKKMAISFNKALMNVKEKDSCKKVIQELGFTTEDATICGHKNHTQHTEDTQPDY
ncbi:substrate-binding periplasmic protein [Maridesulfovibrio sp. FT414]|uniref:substrate-binding periplasmic protein n=1 Tax=Maridesulfovibrio sp. FT414 TaxID=2979469 RepID=UPI003D8061D1